MSRAAVRSGDFIERNIVDLASALADVFSEWWLGQGAFDPDATVTEADLPGGGSRPGHLRSMRRRPERSDDQGDDGDDGE